MLHAALGRLILRAAHDPVDPVAERLAVALQNPQAGAGMVGRLDVIGRLQEARDLVSELLRWPAFLLDLRFARVGLLDAGSDAAARASVALGSQRGRDHADVALWLNADELPQILEQWVPEPNCTTIDHKQAGPTLVGPS